MSTTLGATITVVDASAEAAVQVLQAARNATVAATAAFVVEGLSVSIGIAEDAWKGVDLHTVRAQRRVGKLLTANLSLAQKWLHEQGPSQLGTVSGVISESMSVLDGSTAPFVEFEDTLFDPHGSLVTWIARGRAFGGATGRGVALSIMVTETNFTPSWSNPVWESLEYDVKLEATVSSMSFPNVVKMTLFSSQRKQHIDIYLFWSGQNYSFWGGLKN